MTSLDTARIDEIFATWDRIDSPGCALGVVQDGELVYARGYGSACLEHEVPLTPRSVFYIASTSKQFCALAIAMLQADGKLSADDDIRKFFPELERIEGVTVRHLVHHTCAIRDYLGLLSLAGRAFSDVRNGDEVVELIARQRSLEREPGTAFSYTNSGYVLMSLIVERVTGQTLRAFSDERIFGPLGMTDSYFNDDFREVVARRACGYAPRLQTASQFGPTGGYVLAEDDDNLVGDGGVLTTVEDMARWEANWLRPVVGTPEFLASLVVPGTLTDGTTQDYAWGLMLGKHNGRATVSHGGGLAGFRCEYLRFPDERLCVIVLGNLSTLVPSALARKVADVVLGDAPAAVAAPAQGASEDPRPGVYASDAILVQVGEGGELNVQGNTFRLVKAASGRYGLENGPGWEIEFAQDELRLHLGGEPMVLPRRDVATPSQDELTAAAGHFYSDELDCVWILEAAGGALRLANRRGPTGELVALGDGFHVPSAGGTITPTNGGFVYDGPRTKGIVFKRVAR